MALIVASGGGADVERARIHENDKTSDKGSDKGSDEEEKREALAVRNAALGMLARREHSAAEMVQKLSRKFRHRSVSEFSALVGELAALELQSDERFAEVAIRHRVGRGYGRYYVQQELASKGIGRSLAASKLDAANIDWQAVACDLLERRFRNYQATKDKARAMRLLQRRGFSAQEVRAAAHHIQTQMRTEL